MKQPQSNSLKQTNSKAIANNPAQQKSEMQQGLSIQDNRPETGSFVALNTHCSNCLQNRGAETSKTNAAQLLKIFPKNNEGEADFDGEPEIINFNDIALETDAYKKLCRYLFYRMQQKNSTYTTEKGDIDENTIMKSGIQENDLNELKKARGIANQEYFFEEGDTENLETLINQFEKGEREGNQINEVICNEGQVKEVAKSQSIAFGSITSCIAITIILSDGSKIAAHKAVTCPIPDACEQMKKLIKGREVKYVLVQGALSCWKIDLTPANRDENEGKISDDEEGLKNNMNTSLDISGVIYKIEDFNDGEHSISKDQKKYLDVDTLLKKYFGDVANWSSFKISDVIKWLSNNEEEENEDVKSLTNEEIEKYAKGSKLHTKWKVISFENETGNDLENETGIEKESQRVTGQNKSQRVNKQKSRKRKSEDTDNMYGNELLEDQNVEQVIEQSAEQQDIKRPRNNNDYENQPKENN